MSKSLLSPMFPKEFLRLVNFSFKYKANSSKCSSWPSSQENQILKQKFDDFKKKEIEGKKKEDQFSQKIDELNQETDNLMEEIDKWQM